MLVERLVREVFASNRGHLLSLVVAENAEKVEPHLAAHRWLYSVTSEIAQLLQVDMLLCVEQLDKFLDRGGAHTDMVGPVAFAAVM